MLVPSRITYCTMPLDCRDLLLEMLAVPFSFALHQWMAGLPDHWIGYCWQYSHQQIGRLKLRYQNSDRMKRLCQIEGELKAPPAIGRLVQRNFSSADDFMPVVGRHVTIECSVLCTGRLAGRQVRLHLHMTSRSSKQMTSRSFILAKC